MIQTAKNREQQDEKVLDAVNEMVYIMCPHRMANEIDQLVIDLVTESPDRWDDDRATMFKALREFSRRLCDEVPPKAFDLVVN